MTESMNALELFSVAIWITSIAVAVLIEVITMCCLPNPYAIAMLIVLWSLRLWPLTEKRADWITEFVKLATASSNKYFPSTVVVEDGAEFKKEETYLVGMEPHSVMPVALPSTFNNDTVVVPENLKPIHGVATSVIFWTPIVKHLWWWLGIRPAEKSYIVKCLKKGTSIAIVPGGVRELLHMGPGKEAVFLKQRGGFIKLALQHGAHLVPSFAFRQTELFDYVRLDFIGRKLYESIARTIKFCPLIFWGRWGIPGFPKKVPMTIVIGRPIQVQKIEKPTDEQIQKHLDLFISEMERIFNKYKKQAGCENLILEVY